jgi:hypothetical protein
MKKFSTVLILIISFISIGCLTTMPFNSSNITVTYTVYNNSRNTEWVVIQFKDVLGEVEEELYMRSGESWEKKVNFKLPEYGSEHLILAAHSLNGTFETIITIDDINQSIRSGSRLKTSGREYLSLSQMHINRETIRRYR